MNDQHDKEYISTLNAFRNAFLSNFLGMFSIFVTFFYIYINNKPIQTSEEQEFEVGQPHDIQKVEEEFTPIEYVSAEDISKREESKKLAQMNQLLNYEGYKIPKLPEDLPRNTSPVVNFHYPRYQQSEINDDTRQDTALFQVFYNDDGSFSHMVNVRPATNQVFNEAVKEVLLQTYLRYQTEQNSIFYHCQIDRNLYEAKYSTYCTINFAYI